MSVKKRKEYFGQCQYHYGHPKDGLRAIQLTPGRGTEWQHAIAVCADCRRNLIGFFRYSAINAPYERRIAQLGDVEQGEESGK